MHSGRRWWLRLWIGPKHGPSRMAQLRQRRLPNNQTTRVTRGERTLNARELAVRVLPPPVKRGILRNRRRVVDGLVGYRRLAGRLGPPPSFLIIGYGRCGTTYLYDRLLEHPNI